MTTTDYFVVDDTDLNVKLDQINTLLSLLEKGQLSEEKRLLLEKLIQEVS